MSILVDAETKVICQGITGAQASFHCERAIAYGTKIVGGVTPGRGGERHLHQPVFDSVAAANRQKGWGFTMFSALNYVAAGAIVALFGSLLLAGVLSPREDEVVPAVATEVPSATPALTVETAEPSPEPEVAAPAPLVAGPGPWLTWERAPELDLSQDEWFDEREPQEPLVVSHLPPIP